MAEQGLQDRTMEAVSQAARRDNYLASLMERASRPVPAALALTELRETAQALVREQTFPSTRQEDWRFTDLSAMLDRSFAPGGPTAEAIDGLDQRYLPEPDTVRLVFVNGFYRSDLSSLTGLPTGVVAGNLADLATQADLLAQLSPYLGKQPGFNEVFTALNTTGFTDGALVWVSPSIEMAAPVQVIQVSLPGVKPLMAQPRCLVVVGANSHLTLVEEFWGTGPGDYFTNGVTEVWVDINAQVSHVRLQQEGAQTFHVGKTAVTQARDSRYTCIPITLGGRISRHHLEVYQGGAQTETYLAGLSAIANTQLADTHSTIAMRHPHGTAQQLHKVIVDDRAHGVFNGKIFVPHEAQLTNASQLNRNLLLSGKARVDTKPQLEIVADNVKCAHGATVSQLDADEVFYLQSRGIDATQAQRLLIFGFAMEVIERLPIPSLKARLTDFVDQLAH